MKFNFNLKQFLLDLPPDSSIRRIVLSALFSVISFVIFLIIFLVIQPNFITKIDEDSPRVKMNYYLLVSYSLMFSILIGLVVIFYLKPHDTNNKSNSNDKAKAGYAYNPGLNPGNTTIVRL